MPKSLPLNQVLQGDCVDILATLPAKSVDVVFADPPYNLQLQRDLYRPNLSKVDAVSDKWDKFNGFSEYDKFTKDWLEACHRVLKDTGTIWVIGTYHNIFRVGSIMQDLKFWILNDIVWIKTNPMPNFRGVRFANAHETLIWAQKKKGAHYTFNHFDAKSLNDDLQMRSDWVLPITSSRERVRVNGSKLHSTQKPSALLYRVLLTSTNPGDVVLDPFFGSGTTGVVSKLLGRNWIGVDREKKYIKAAEKRIAGTATAPENSISLDQVKSKRRLPFGVLLEYGYLKPGQILTTSRGDVEATILSNGKLSCAGQVESIHGMARVLTNTPANGWDFWFYEDEKRRCRTINELRERARKDLNW